MNKYRKVKHLIGGIKYIERENEKQQHLIGYIKFSEGLYLQFRWMSDRKEIKTIFLTLFAYMYLT